MLLLNFMHSNIVFRYYFTFQMYTVFLQQIGIQQVIEYNCETVPENDAALWPLINTRVQLMIGYTLDYNSVIIVMAYMPIMLQK